MIGISYVLLILLLSNVIIVNANISQKIVNSNIISNNLNKLMIRGGKKKDLGFITMIRAFYLTLINPANEESLKEEKSSIKKKPIFKKSSFLSGKKK